MYFEWEGKSNRLAVLALTIGLILGALLGYSFGIDNGRAQGYALQVLEQTKQTAK